MPKYLSGRVKRTPQYKLTDDRYNFLGLEQTEPNLGDPNATINYNISAATYNPSSGDLTITIGSHNLSVNDKIRIFEESITFTCAQDNHFSQHKYPRSTDPAGGNPELSIKERTNTTVTVNVGTTPSKSFTPSGGSYTPATGILVLDLATNHQLESPSTHTVTNAAYTPGTGNLTLTVAGHGFGEGELVQLADDSLTFSCTHGSGNKTYPRSSDPISGRWIQVVNPTTNTFDIQVLDAFPSTNTTTHTFITAANNGLKKVKNSVRLSEGAVTFRCAQDSNGSDHAYPRSTIDTHTAASGTTYNPQTGLVRIAVANHGMRNGDWVKLDTGTLKFKCMEDNNATEHDYPRNTDPIANKWIRVRNVTTNTFDIQVLANVPSTNTTTHTFVSATSGGIKQKRDRAYDTAVPIVATTASSISLFVGESSNTTTHQFQSALTNSVTSGGDYTHTFVSATTGAAQSGNDNSSVPAGQQYQMVSLPTHPGQRYWVPIGGGLIPGAISVFNESVLVGTASSITQLDFVGAAVTATAQPMGIAATISINPVTVADNPPNIPAPRMGELWWESDTGELYIYYDDPNSGQWVQTNAGGRGATGPQGPPGSAGSAGPPGPAGDAGPPGPAGDDGDDGPAGPPGPQGNQGNQGTQGSPGAQGPPGPAGPPGSAGPPGPQGDQGTQGTQGPQGIQGIQGIQGDKGGLRYKFLSSNLISDPGAGNFRYSSGSFGSISNIVLDSLTTQSTDLSDFIATWDDSTNTSHKGTLVVQSNENSDDTYSVFTVTSVVDNGGWLNISVSPVAGTIPSNNEQCVLNFSRTGNSGSGGSAGPPGPAGVAGLDIGTSPPSGPSSHGDMWWDSDDGDLHVYYNDGNSFQWVTVSAGPAGSPGPPGGQAPFVSDWQIPV